MRGPGPTQRSNSGGGATASVEEGTVHGNTLATVSASSSRSVQFPEVESQALDGGHRRSDKWGHGSRRNALTLLGREGRGSVRHHREQTNPAQRVPPPQRHQKFPRAESRGPHRRVEGVRISRRQGRGGVTASWRFLTGHHRRPGDR